MKKIIFFLVFSGLCLPFISLARTYQAELPGGGTTRVTYDGLVPCGKCVTITPPFPLPPDSLSVEKCGGAADVRYLHCQFCHFFVMLDEILDFLLFKLVLPIAALMLVIAGLLYVGSIFEFLPGGPQTLTQAKSIISSVFIGLFIIFGAWLIINLFFMLIGVNTGIELGRSLNTWFEINCPIKL